MELAKRPLQKFAAFLGSATIRSIVLVWTLGIVMFGLELAFAFLLQRFVTSLGVMSSAIASSSPSGALRNTTLIIASVGLARVVTVWAQSRVDGRAMERFCHRLRVRFIASALSSSTIDSGPMLTFFHQRILNASLALRSFSQAVSFGIIALGLVLALAWMNAALTAALLCVVGMAYLPMRVMHRRLRATAVTQVNTFSKVMEKLSNALRNSTLIRVHNLQASEQRRFEEYLRAYTGDIHTYLRVEGLVGAGGSLLVIAGIIAIAAAQGSSIALERGLVVPYLYLFFRLSQQLGAAAASLNRLAYTSPDLLHVMDWSRQRNDPFDVPAARNQAIAMRSAVGWSLRGVTFGYRSQAPLFSDFHFNVAPGSLVHIAGPSGSGKTSLIALMTGEAAPSSGTVVVKSHGAESAVEAVRDQLRTHIGYASAEPYLFAGTIAENITYGLHSAPDQALLTSMTGLAECGFIHELPAGFDHLIDELGHGLSTGQRQRVSLLRALLRRPRALILDEALSNVDRDTESRILANLNALRPDCTIVWVSHRSPATRPDAILELHLDAERVN
ncbi:MAG: ABC transporter ATP-binding protein/permease [Acidobacteriota bacterium]|nr:ABC transporter ATP-binding protein/permease [Acidobacteriota bacterium]